MHKPSCQKLRSQGSYALNGTGGRREQWGEGSWVVVQAGGEGGVGHRVVSQGGGSAPGKRGREEKEG